MEFLHSNAMKLVGRYFVGLYDSRVIARGHLLYTGFTMVSPFRIRPPPPPSITYNVAEYLSGAVDAKVEPLVVENSTMSCKCCDET